MARVIAHIVPNALGMAQSIVDVTTADGHLPHLRRRHRQRHDGL